MPVCRNRSLGYHAVYHASLEVLGYPPLWIHTAAECAAVLRAIERNPERFQPHSQEQTQ